LTFSLYKFRAMVENAEKFGARWTEKKDPRITRVGRFLRSTRIDELPQLWNVLLGEMSFIGPRPERPDFNSDLEAAIPYYDLRHLVKPGITGWALYPYGASVQDAREKLQYDLFSDARSRDPDQDPPGGAGGARSLSKPWLTYLPLPW
jgi:lipopolysaccharide/colanic/teichoic acid biosynthesis glycosyltransferase